MHYAICQVYSRPVQFSSTMRADDVPAEGLVRAHGSTRVAIPAAHVRGVHDTRQMLAWTRVDRVPGGRSVRTSSGGRVAATPVDVELRALSFDAGGGQHVFILGARDEVLSRLLGPQRTGVLVRVTAGTVMLRGLRPGVRGHLWEGDQQHLDPITWAGAEVTIDRPAQTNVRFDLVVDHPLISIQKWDPPAEPDGTGRWVDVSSTLSLQAATRIRVRPAE